MSSECHEQQPFFVRRFYLTRFVDDGSRLLARLRFPSLAARHIRFVVEDPAENVVVTFQILLEARYSVRAMLLCRDGVGMTRVRIEAETLEKFIIGRWLRP